MPTTNKRVNLTIPEPLYERIQTYKRKNGIASDAAACLQLVVRQLDGIDNTEKVLEAMSRFTLEEVQEMSALGYETIQAIAKERSVAEQQQHE